MHWYTIAFGSPITQNGKSNRFKFSKTFRLSFQEATPPQQQLRILNKTTIKTNEIILFRHLEFQNWLHKQIYTIEFTECTKSYNFYANSSTFRRKHEKMGVEFSSFPIGNGRDEILIWPWSLSWMFEIQNVNLIKALLENWTCIPFNRNYWVPEPLLL